MSSTCTRSTASGSPDTVTALTTSGIAVDAREHVARHGLSAQ